MYVDLVKVLSSFIFVCFLFIKALSIERTSGSFLVYNSPYELFTSTLNNKTSFTAWGSLAVLKGSWWFFLSWSESDWVRYPHSSMLHYAYSTWIMKIMAKRVNCLKDDGFVLKYRTPATIRNVVIARWENLLLKIF